MSDRDEMDDAAFEAYTWALDQRLPGAQEKLVELLDRRARERAEEEASLPDLPEMIVVLTPPTRERIVRFDGETGLLSGGSLDHNRTTLRDFPGRDDAL